MTRQESYLASKRKLKKEPKPLVSLLQALPEGGEHEVRVALRAPHLGGHEHLLAARDDPAPRRPGHGLADDPLGAVHRCGVDVAVPDLQRGEQGAPEALLPHGPERRRSEPHRRHRAPSAAERPRREPRG
ncbi:Os04g0447533, partial [Oryza sativa Japonica Group]